MLHLASACSRALLFVLLALGLVTSGACASARATDPRLIEDAQTLARIRSAIVNDAALGLRPIQVRVAAGTAHLTGRVGSDAEAQRLVELVRGVAGVTTVESEVTVVPEASGEPLVVTSDPGDSANERRFLAVGLSVGSTHARDAALDGGLSVAALFRIGSGTGLAPTAAFNWTTVELINPRAAAAAMGHIRLRPVMAGAGYTWGGGRTSTTVSLVGGYSFNSLSLRAVSPGDALVVAVNDSFAWRPAVSIWRDLNARLALNAFAGYLVVRPRITVLDDERVDARSLRADTAVVRVGLAYKVF
jgi:hypothetical protein